MLTLSESKIQVGWQTLSTLLLHSQPRQTTPVLSTNTFNPRRHATLILPTTSSYSHLGCFILQLPFWGTNNLQEDFLIDTL